MKIEDKKFNINLKFYFFLKYLVKINFSDKQLVGIFKSFNTKEYQNSFIHIKECINTNSKNGLSKLNFLEQIIYEIKDEIDAKLFLFALKIFSIKNFLLELAKLKQISNAEKLLKLDPLSIEYDKITIYNPYATRVNGALLSLIFFDYLNSPKKDFIKDFSQEYMNKIINLANELKPHGLEANQIFMLIFSESINQSIISDSGGDYENRILQKLNFIGIPKEKITKEHDKNDSSTEFDFFFNLNGKTYGIGAKRTLRERYKQFIKTAQMTKIDVMIEITLGLDLTEEKAKAIRNHGVYLFVADEIYRQNKYLQNIEGVFSSLELTLNLLRKL